MAAITEEPNFRYFIEKCRGAEFTYVGDNLKKDFIVQNRLGWKTVMLKDDGRNIHKQEAVAMGNLPKITIIKIEELVDYTQ